MTALLDVPLCRRLRRIPVLPWVHGRLATRAWSWDVRDQWTRDWWPQGITWAGSLLLVSWYEATGGSRVSVVDMAAGRYGHVTLQRPDGAPLRVHAGGLAWVDGWLYVAATARGFWSLHVDDLDAARGRWPARQLHRPALPGSSTPFRWSFLDAAPGWSSSEERQPGAGVETTHLYAGEYGRGQQSTRLARVPLVEGLPTGDLEHLADGPRGMQGVVAAGDELLVSTSAGPWCRGELALVEPAESEGIRAETRRPRALPIGVEDLTRDRQSQLWTAAEHPGRRAIVCLAPD